MKIHKYKNYDQVSKRAAAEVIRQIVLKPDSILGLATGTSPIGLYERLIKAYNDYIISFKDVKTFNLDEYVGLPKEHPESYYSFMHKHLFDHIDIQEKNINIPSTEMEKITSLAEEYNKKMFGNQRDLQILGIGTNAHIGFNEPGSDVGNQTFVVKLDEQTRIDNSRFFNSLEEVPTHAITMGIKNIMFSKKIVLVASGKNKADAIYQMALGEIKESVPASILQLHPNVIVIVDEDAASKLNMDGDYLEF